MKYPEILNLNIKQSRIECVTVNNPDPSRSCHKIEPITLGIIFIHYVINIVRLQKNQRSTV